MLKASIHGQWSRRATFISAAVGSAIGLGNIWRFPYLVGEYGGLLFVLIYLICAALVGLPLVIAEVMIGRMGRQSPINSIRQVAEQSGRSRHWQFIGWVMIVAGFFILSFCSVVAGWSMAYVFRSALGGFDGITEDDVSRIFGSFISDPEKMLAWHTLFLLMTYYIVSHGIYRGIELALKILMPVLLAVLILLLGYAISFGHFIDGLGQMLTPDVGRLSDVKRLGLVILVAMEQAFFTLGLGVGAMAIYGAYSPSNMSIAGVSITVVLLDMLFAVVVGLVISAIVLASGLDIAAFNNGLSGVYGPGQIFQTLPMGFGHMPWGSLFGGLFFLLIVIVLLMSSIALLEPIVAYLIERYEWERRYAAGVTASIAWMLGLITIFSFSVGSDVYPFASLGILVDKTIYHLLDILVSHILLPFSGLLIVVFAGWILPWRTTEDELSMGENCKFALWRLAVRYITPVLLLIVLLYSLLKATGYSTDLL